MDALPDRHPVVAQAIAVLGRQHALAEAIGCRQQRISKLLNREIPVTAEDAVAIHRATEGKVSAHALRPDLFPRGFEPPVEEMAAQ